MKISKKLLWVLVVASAAPALFFRILEWHNGQIKSLSEFFFSLLFNTLISIVVTLTIALVILRILYWLNKVVPWNENVLKRLVIEVCLTFPAALLLGYILGNLAYLINIYNTLPYRNFIFTFLAISGIMNLVLVAISDWFYFFERWKDSLVEKEKEVLRSEKLEKEKIMAQYEVLKNQINPHFLFNCLNVLSSLIHIDPKKAIHFVDEFAGLYRFVLAHNERDTVPLKEEIQVSKSYSYLQKIRFSESVFFEFSLQDKEMEHFHVFPLSVQTIIENAIKHNRSSKENPLYIKVWMENNYLVIENNLQTLQVAANSTGIGLKNLMQRYKPYGLAPQFIKTETTYTARLPLLNKNSTQQPISETQISAI